MPKIVLIVLALAMLAGCATAPACRTPTCGVHSSTSQPNYTGHFVRTGIAGYIGAHPN